MKPSAKRLVAIFSVVSVLPLFAAIHDVSANDVVALTNALKNANSGNVVGQPLS